MRTKNPITVFGPDGRPLAGAAVLTRIRSTGADATVYAAETGGAAGTNPAVTDATGRVTQWLERGAYSSLVTATGLDPYAEDWDSAPAGDDGVDADWIDNDAAGAGLLAVRQADGTVAWTTPAAALPDGSITTPKLADDAVTQPKLAPAVEDRIFSKAAGASGFNGVYTNSAGVVAFALPAATFRGGKVLVLLSGGRFENNSSGITQVAVIGIALDGAYVTEWAGGAVGNGGGVDLGAFSTLVTVPAGVHTIGFMHRSSDGTGSTRLRGDNSRPFYATAVEL